MSSEKEVVVQYKNTTMMATGSPMSAQALFDSLSHPDTDETVKEYVCSLLEEADPDETDAEELVETLQAFFGDDQSNLATELVNRWMAQKRKDSTPTTPVKQILSSPKKISLADSSKSQPQSPPHKDNASAPQNSTKKPTRQQRKAARKGKKNGGKKQDDSDSSQHDDAPQGTGNWAEKDDDDFATAWNECKEQGVEWGGRGRGGRGVQAGSNSIRSNIHLANVTVSVPGGGLELLSQAQFDLAMGHRYGLVGRNG
jgi:hypothetical protein